MIDGWCPTRPESCSAKSACWRAVRARQTPSPKSDALLLELTQRNYERLTAEHPALVGKLLLNIGLLLASRVRALTDELRSEQSAR